ncbi:DUF7312 domain-containing protein [Halorussus halophilus]|uniref:DUF7312 domain-containing protein n=1 Tax=Halorussus halophilus TaxID=2650975 RepID=UPI0013016153|nr:hypothetical protein [Halorussus halophilus]
MSDSDWKYDPEDVGPEAEQTPPEPEPETLEPGSPSAENALFVALGVLTMLAVFFRIALLAA